MINGFMKLLITWLIRNDILKLFPNIPFPNFGRAQKAILIVLKVPKPRSSCG